MEITRARIDGLLAAFPKLINSEQQHTFIETESVRYVYQPMEALYMVLITTKNSNILEDLETLRLFAKVVPEYCKIITDTEVAQHAFELIFAFDEIVALGYRENVNLSQIRTFTDMDSHDENVYKMIKKNKEKEAKENAKRREKELQMQRRTQQKMGGGKTGFAGGFGSDSAGPSSYGGGAGAGPSSSSYSSGPSSASVAPIAAAPVAAAASEAKKAPGRGMKLGGKPKTSEFMDALAAEGEAVPAKAAATASSASAAPVAAAPAAPEHGVSIKIDETINMSVSHDGGMDSLEVKGMMTLLITDPASAFIRVHFTKRDDPNINFQSHPNVDKKLMSTESIIALKSADKPFPVGTELGVLKWRFQTTDEASIPLTINCWPNVNSDGSCDVNIDYELQNTSLALQDVVITIPLPSGAGAPVIGSCDGEYGVDTRKGILEWRLPVIDKSNTTGSMEFSIRARDSKDFFPVLVAFEAPTTFAGVEVAKVLAADSGAPVLFSSDVKLVAEKYEIV